VGGDGTVRACAHHLAGTGAPLAVVARGTANLFAKSLGIPSRLAEALGTGFGGSERLVDMAEADGSPFVAMAGMGIDAEVVHSTPHLMKEHFGWAGYALAALPHLAGAANEVTVHLDGAEPFVRQARSVVVGNVGILPGGVTLLPGASLDDGLLDVGVLVPAGLLGWAGVARRVVAGRSSGGPVEHYKARHVEVRSKSPLWRQVDGDVIGRGFGLCISVHHKALLVRVPLAPTGERGQRNSHRPVGVPNSR